MFLKIFLIGNSYGHHLQHKNQYHLKEHKLNILGIIYYYH